MSVMQNVSEYFRRVWGPQGSLGKNVSLRSIVLGILGVALLVIGTVFSPENSQQQNSDVQPQKAAVPELVSRSYEDMLEGKLANKLSQIQGVGAVMVAITLESGPQQEYAKNIVRESRITQEKDNTGGTRVTTETKENEQVLVSRESGADRPVIARELKPEIKGVMVVAEGANDSNIKAQLVRAVESGLGIPTYKITVLPQKR